MVILLESCMVSLHRREELPLQRDSHNIHDEFAVAILKNSNTLGPVQYQELMSGKAAKERATTAYARVPSKSKLLASELPNMETCSSI